jgi:hypothetical protein
MARAVLTGRGVSKPGSPTALDPYCETVSTLLAASGTAVFMIGWVDLALLWIPWDFGNVEWEFGTIGAHMAAMPLSTVGLALLAAGAVGHGWRGLTLALAIIAGLILAFLVAIGAVYALTLPVAYGGAPPGMRLVLWKAMGKTSGFLVIYATFHGWMAVYLWRTGRRTMRSAPVLAGPLQ